MERISFQWNHTHGIVDAGEHEALFRLGQHQDADRELAAVGERELALSLSRLTKPVASGIVVGSVGGQIFAANAARSTDEARGERARRFLGWSKERHWLLG